MPGTITNPAEPETLIDRRRWLALVVVCLGQLLVIVDTTIVNVALPSIRADLGFDQAGLAWVVDAYLVTFGSFLLLGGRLGDLVGRKRVFLGGVTLFTLASLLCGVAQSQEMLLAGRFLQGLGSAGASSAVLALIVIQFPGPAERAKAMSVYTFVLVSGGSLGLVLGGALTDAIDWHWIFFINLPIGLAALVLGRRMIESDEGIGLKGGVDWAGSVLITAALMTGIYAIVKVPEHGWGSANTLGFLALSGALLTALVVLERRLDNPILPPHVFRLRSLIDSSLVRAGLVTGMYAMFFLRSLYMERVEHADALQTGLSFLPQTLVVAALSLGVTNSLVRRFGPRTVLLGGLALMTAGLSLIATAGQDTSYFPVPLLALLLMGLGAGGTFMPLVVVAMEDVPAEDAGLASGLVNVSVQLGGALGLAVLSTIASGHSKSLAAGGASPVDALVGGYQLAFWLAAGCVAAAGVFAARRLRGRAPATVEPERELVEA
jgi:EmrB/QacA subfamily drug resistance transporter